MGGEGGVEAYSILENDPLLRAMLQSKGYTAFIPTNEAFNSYNGSKDTKLMEYHLVSLAYKVQDLPDELNSMLPGNPLLYVAKIASGDRAVVRGFEDYHTYINNAKIIDGNFESLAADGSKQYLHIVDQVIAPALQYKIPANTPADYKNPTADKLLLRPHLYGLEGQYSISTFEKRVSKLDLMDVFSMEGKHTFFIPVNQALNDSHHANIQDLIDKQVVHGHVIPDHVLFTRTVEKPTDQFESMAFSDNLKVVLFMENVTRPDSNVMTYYVKSNIVAGDVSHEKGTAMARIPKGNIPVKNGVVHLIDRPLMIVASTIISYLQEKDGQLSKFHNLMREHYQDMIHELMVEKDRTLFAPSNTAFRMVNQERLQKVTLNSERLKRLVRMHIVPNRLTTDEIVARTVTQEDTLSPRRNLYFAVNNPNEPVPIVSLEGGGVNATITTPNIAAKNGVIHIINRILGIPSQTVYEKLATDPMLSATFALSEQNTGTSA
ncbi:hypothetical protein Pcinc_019720 [Petrolisthes cinctipes]|uniref:FAS1 domain-containing protein n=1 Tax=Petrolisthes cinctipes TaxID=88211 RepID=A0AAE1KKS5_PETCI|nr:hypothetical protein Pcinc_019720 [Petrolisthes cinctipes]